MQNLPNSCYRPSLFLSHFSLPRTRARAGVPLDIPERVHYTRSQALLERANTCRARDRARLFSPALSASRRRNCGNSSTRAGARWRGEAFDKLDVHLTINTGGYRSKSSIGFEACVIVAADVRER